MWRVLPVKKQTCLSLVVDDWGESEEGCVSLADITTDDVASHHRRKSMEGRLVGLIGEAQLPVDMVGIGRKGRELESDTSNYNW